MKLKLDSRGKVGTRGPRVTGACSAGNISPWGVVGRTPLDAARTSRRLVPTFCNGLKFDHSDRLRPLLDLLAQRKIFLSPTLAVFERRRGDRGVTEIEARGFENMLQFVRLAHRAGVTMVVGSHSEVPKAEHGCADQREMELLGECGLTPMEVIAAATRNNAAFFRKPHRTNLRRSSSTFMAGVGLRATRKSSPAWRNISRRESRSFRLISGAARQRRQ